MAVRSRVRAHPRARRAAGVLAVALLGGWLGLLAGGSVSAPVGPVDARFRAVPSLTGGTRVEIPPLGSLTLDSHAGPLRLVVAVERVDDQKARRLLADPSLINGLGERASAEVVAGLRRLAVQVLLATFAGAGLLGLLVWRRPTQALASGGLAAAITAGAAAVGAASFQQGSLAQPTYDGLLASAPSLVGSAANIVNDFARYEQQLADLVTNVSQLYATTSNLPTFGRDDDTIVALHVSDLHLNPSAWGIIGSISDQFQVDLIIDTGDIVDWGSTTEDLYVQGIATLDKPYVFVRGNHDSIATAAAVAAQPNAVVLDRSVREVAGLRIAGIADPRFTPDQSTRTADDALELPLAAGRRLARVVKSAGEVDVALLHDPTGAEPLDGVVPLVLGGHGHRRVVDVMPEGTRMLQQGSTGGAGLRGLQQEEPTPAEASVLYFDRADGDLLAYDDITLGGLGLASAQIERTVVDPPPG
jgi:predicted MPP superfamily phosphohydrolase